jgi:hypothetical protein
MSDERRRGSSSLDWKDEGFTLEQVTQFPLEQGTTLEVKSSRPIPRAIHVRIPGWTAGVAEVRINGRLLEAVADPGSYIGVRRVWRDGDTLTVRLPMELREEALAGDDSVTAFLYGPLVLAADLGAGPPDGPNRVIHGRATAPENIPPPVALPEAGGKRTVVFSMVPVFLTALSGLPRGIAGSADDRSGLDVAAVGIKSLHDFLACLRVTFSIV